jgi:hypothetical protein
MGCSPCSMRQARVSSQAWVALMRLYMSASLWRMTWWSASRLPKVLRSRAQVMASSRQTFEKPMAPALMPIRSPLKFCMMPEKPMFSWADQVLDRHPHIVEIEGGGVGGPPALLLQFGAREALTLALDQQQGDAAGPLPAGAHGDGVVVGPHAAGDEHLGAVDDVVVAVQPGRGAQVGDVAAARRLGDGQGRDLLARQHLRDDAVLHLLAAHAPDRRQADAVAHQAGVDPAGAVAGHLLAGDDRHEGVGRHAAVLFRPAQPQQADVRGLAIELAREGP